MIRIQDLYPQPAPIFTPGTSPLAQKYANASQYARIGQGNQSLIVGDAYIAGAVPPIVQHNQCINVPQPAMGSELSSGAYVFISNVDFKGVKHYIKSFEGSYDFISVANDLSTRRRQMLPTYTTDVNEAAIFRIYPNNTNSRTIAWNEPIYLETGGMWLSTSSLNYRTDTSHLSDGFPPTESFYQIEGDVSPHLLYSTPIANSGAGTQSDPIEPINVKDGEIFRFSEGHYPVLGLYGCNWGVDYAGSQDLNVISNARRVARSCNVKYNKCFWTMVALLVFALVAWYLYREGSCKGRKSSKN